MDENSSNVYLSYDNYDNKKIKKTNIKGKY